MSPKPSPWVKRSVPRNVSLLITWVVHVVSFLTFGADIQITLRLVGSLHSRSNLPSPSTSTRQGDSFPTEGYTRRRFQCPGLFFGFSYQYASLLGNPIPIRSVQPSWFTSIGKSR